MFNLGRPWDIRLGRGGPVTRTSSVTAGLFPGAVDVSCNAGAELVQVDLTPLGAVRLLGEAAADLASQIVDLDSIDGRMGDCRPIPDQLCNTSSWQARFDLVERFLSPRFTRAASGEVEHAWTMLAHGHSVLETASAIGWSTRHLSARFRLETGIRPVTAARMLRFQRARALALGSGFVTWAGIAADAGCSD